MLLDVCLCFYCSEHTWGGVGAAKPSSTSPVYGVLLYSISIP